MPTHRFAAGTAITREARGARRPARIFLALSLVAALLGCQTTGPTRSLDDTDAALEFERPAYAPPKRTVADLVGRIRRPEAPSYRCSESARERRDEILVELAADPSSSVTIPAYVENVRDLLEAELGKGNYRTGMEVARAAIQASGGRGFAGDWWAELGRIQASVGAVEAARDSRRRARSAWGLDRDRMRARYFDGLLMADIALATGDVDEAQRLYHAMIDLLREGKWAHPRERVYGTYGRWGDPIEFEWIYRGLATVAVSRGELADAERWARKAVTGTYSVARYGSKTAAEVSLLSEILLEQGRLAEAEELTQLAIDMHEHVCAPPEILSYARARAVRAQLEIAKGHWAGALAEFEALEGSLAHDPGTFLRLYGADPDWMLALVLTEQPERALVRLGESIRTLEARYGRDSYEVAEAMGILAMAHAAAGDPSSAMRAYREAMPRLLGVPIGLGGRAGPPSRDERLRLILESYLIVLHDLHESGTDTGPEIDPVAEMFRVANAARGQRVNATVAATAARGATSDPELAGLARREQEAARTITLVAETLRDLESAPAEQVDPLLATSLRERLGTLRGVRRGLLAELDRRFPEYARIVTPIPATLAEARAVLRAGEALVSTYTGDSRTFVWVVPHTGAPRFAAAPLGRERLRTTVAALRRSLDPDARTIGEIPAFDLDLAHALYQTLLRPVEGGLAGASQLLVVTNDALGQVPFAVLVKTPATVSEDRESLFTRYRDVDWLSRSHAISRLPSVYSLVALRRAGGGSADRTAYAGFGDPWFNDTWSAFERAPAPGAMPSRAPASASIAARGGRLERRRSPETRSAASAVLADLPHLPDTAEEIRTQASALGADQQRDVFLGKAASETNVKRLDLSGRRVLAFATHGLVPGDLDGLTQPALALSSPEAAGGTDDGLLTMEEIFGLELDADWVVLSACNTAAADGSGVESVSGLGRAFFYAGARSLLVSNWPVETTSAKTLTTTIFRLQAEDASLTRAEALRRAMLRLLDEGGYADEGGRMLFSYAHPIFWAPFSLVGDGGNAGRGQSR